MFFSAWQVGWLRGQEWITNSWRFNQTCWLHKTHVWWLSQQNVHGCKPGVCGANHRVQEGHWWMKHDEANVEVMTSTRHGWTWTWSITWSFNRDLDLNLNHVPPHFRAMFHHDRQKGCSVFQKTGPIFGQHCAKHHRLQHLLERPLSIVGPH